LCLMGYIRIRWFFDEREDVLERIRAGEGVELVGWFGWIGNMVNRGRNAT